MGVWEPQRSCGVGTVFARVFWLQNLIHVLEKICTDNFGPDVILCLGGITVNSPPQGWRVWRVFTVKSEDAWSLRAGQWHPPSWSLSVTSPTAWSSGAMGRTRLSACPAEPGTWAAWLPQPVMVPGPDPSLPSILVPHFHPWPPAGLHPSSSLPLKPHSCLLPQARGPGTQGASQPQAIAHADLRLLTWSCCWAYFPPTHLSPTQSSRLSSIPESSLGPAWASRNLSVLLSPETLMVSSLTILIRGCCAPAGLSRCSPPTRGCSAFLEVGHQFLFHRLLQTQWVLDTQ